MLLAALCVCVCGVGCVCVDCAGCVWMGRLVIPTAGVCDVTVSCRTPNSRTLVYGCSLRLACASGVWKLQITNYKLQTFKPIELTAIAVS